MRLLGPLLQGGNIVFKIEDSLELRLSICHYVSLLSACVFVSQGILLNHFRTTVRSVHKKHNKLVGERGVNAVKVNDH